MDYELIIRPEAREDLLDTFHWHQDQSGTKIKDRVSDLTSNYVQMKP